MDGDLAPVFAAENADTYEAAVVGVLAARRPDYFAVMPGTVSCFMARGDQRRWYACTFSDGRVRPSRPGRPWSASDLSGLPTCGEVPAAGQPAGPAPPPSPTPREGHPHLPASRFPSPDHAAGAAELSRPPGRGCEGGGPVPRTFVVRAGAGPLLADLAAANREIVRGAAAARSRPTQSVLPRACTVRLRARRGRAAVPRRCRPLRREQQSRPRHDPARLRHRGRHAARHRSPHSPAVSVARTRATQRKDREPWVSPDRSSSPAPHSR